MPSGSMVVEVPEDGTLKRVPLLVFTPEEIANLRGVMGRSNWCCAVTNKMREYLADPKVAEYLESK